MDLSLEDISSFQNTVYSFFSANKRSLPWRKTTDSYRIMVSEIMLQQTQVPRVIEKYSSFIQRFPDVKSLAKAPLKEVLQEWSGLGYNRRGLFLKKATEVILENHNGKMPETVEGLDALPGIGYATAAAICTYAYNKSLVFIETNVRTVFIHYFFHDKEGIDDKELLPLVKETLDHNNPRKWYNALMDYGTYLKEKHTNPSRSSKHYARQSRFEGSTRQLRSKILKLVLATSHTREELLKAVGNDPRLDDMLTDLIAEGFLRKKGKRIEVV